MALWQNFVVSSDKRPPIDHLRTLLAVYRAGSFSDAGRRLGISQPTVTNHIGGLEAWLGKDLFARTATGVEPTSYAHHLAAAMGDQIDQIDRIFTTPTGAESAIRRIVIGGPREFVVRAVIPALGPDASTLPALTVHFGQSQELLKELESGKLDLVVSTVRPRHPELTAWPIADEEFWLVAAADYPIPQGSLTQLSAVPMVSYNEGLAIIRRFWNSVFNAEPFFDPAVVIPDLVGVRDAVLAGFGMSVLPSYLIRDEVGSGRLKRIDDAEDPPINTVFLVASTAVLATRPHLRAIASRIVARVKEYQSAAE